MFPRFWQFKINWQNNSAAAWVRKKLPKLNFEDGFLFHIQYDMDRLAPTACTAKQLTGYLGMMRPYKKYEKGKKKRNRFISLVNAWRVQLVTTFTELTFT